MSAPKLLYMDKFRFTTEKKNGLIITKINYGDGFFSDDGIIIETPEEDIDSHIEVVKENISLYVDRVLLKHDKE